MWRDMDVRETYIQSTATGNFWSELARESEGDLSTRGGDFRVLFNPLVPVTLGAKGALWGEMRDISNSPTSVTLGAKGGFWRGNEGVIPGQLTDVGDF